MASKIERVGTKPLILAIFEMMSAQQLIDGIFIAHGNWSGLMLWSFDVFVFNLWFSPF